MVNKIIANSFDLMKLHYLMLRIKGLELSFIYEDVSKFGAMIKLYGFYNNPVFHLWYVFHL